MGFYINPGNGNFKEIRNDDYIDKSGLISVINQTIDRKNRLSCVSRPRRFGKTYAANMLEAYYDCSCDSHALFDDLEIAKDPDYEKHMNQYNVLYLDITGFMADTTLAGLPAYILNRILCDVRNEYPDFGENISVKEALSALVKRTSRKFIAIIDEWDSPVRDPASTPKTQKDYLDFLRSLFKSDITKNVFAAAYMTGILPIKKDGTQSAISEFREYSILSPERFAPYVGFLEEDVQGICDAHHVSFDDMKTWYDGYVVETPDKERLSVYNPKYDPSPALIIELRAGGTPEEAIEQIRSRNYASSVESLGSSFLLVAITYDKDDKTMPHHCLISQHKYINA